MPASPDNSFKVVSGSSVKFMLGSDVCIRLMEQKPIVLLERIAACRPGEVAVSAVSVAELRHWALRTKTVPRANDEVNEFLSMVEVLEFGETAATIYGTVREKMDEQGGIIDPLERLVAAHALSINATYITARRSGFATIERLRVADWTK